MEQWFFFKCWFLELLNAYTIDCLNILIFIYWLLDNLVDIYWIGFWPILILRYLSSNINIIYGMSHYQHTGILHSFDLYKRKKCFFCEVRNPSVFITLCSLCRKKWDTLLKRVFTYFSLENHLISMCTPLMSEFSTMLLESRFSYQNTCNYVS